MTWSVEEGDGTVLAFLVLVRDDVCGEVLRDAACLAVHDVGLPDVIKKRGLAVVDVSHDDDDGRAGSCCSFGFHDECEGSLLAGGVFLSFFDYGLFFCGELDV